MPDFKTKIPGVEQATTAPKRTDVKEGSFVAMIMKADPSMTKGPPPLQQLALEFQIIHEDNPEKSIEFRGRRVWQNYITESEDPELQAVRAYQLRLLLLAAGVKFTTAEDGGCRFNTDHLVSKMVKIKTVHKPKKDDSGRQKKDDNGNPQVFVNVNKVDTVAPIDEGSLL